MSQSQDFGHCFNFNEIFYEEIRVINQRRQNDRQLRKDEAPARDDIKLEDDGRDDSTGTRIIFPRTSDNVVGLSLSGGGVRSAAFCLGALQALHEAKALGRVDYLSTVSGGGYIGCSLSAALEIAGSRPKKDSNCKTEEAPETEDNGRLFPFAVNEVEDETPSTQHVRDYSNYLFPRGSRDIFDNVAIYFRGLVANIVTVMPYVLLAAAATIFSHPTIESLDHPNVLGIPVPRIFGIQYFVVTTYLVLILLVLCVLWGVVRSMAPDQSDPEIEGSPKTDWKELFHGLRRFFGLLPSLLSSWPTIVGLVAILVIIAFVCELQQFVLAEMFEHRIAVLRKEDSGALAKLAASINSIAVILTSLGTVFALLGRKLAEFVKVGKESNRWRAQIAGYASKIAICIAATVVPIVLWLVYINLSYWGICVSGTEPVCNAPSFLKGDYLYLKVALAYLLLALVLFLISLRLRPNANSLHPLYRDRLGKAFLFEPRCRVPQDEWASGLKRSMLKLSGLSGRYGPYHLINTALNIQNSAVANRRGRNADFFLLSPRFVGSESTEYVATTDYDTLKMGIDLATAMAISGAAASSNMGAQSIKPLTPTLALLNVRLGYWLRNPKEVKHAKPGQWNKWASLYYFYELIGRLDETKKSVYLTDGGHIENLGIYELLKRSCRVIIAVDAEADPEMAFGSFNTLVRYARIDLGIEIDLPWQALTNRTKETNAKIEETGDAPKHLGPHCAIGRITYSRVNGRPERTGILVYIKSSLTGDENDYVYHYKKRYWAFPHETTLDQMFSEEQFEAYRALGYHATNGLFTRRDDFAKTSDLNAMLTDVNVLDRLFPLAIVGKAGEKRLFADWLRSEPAEPAGDDR